AASMLTLSTFALAAVLRPKRTGPITIDRVTESQPSGAFALRLSDDQIAASIASTTQLGDFSIAPEGDTRKRTLLDFTEGPDGQDAAMFRKRVVEHQAHLAKLFLPVTSPAADQLNLFDARFRAQLLQSINPNITITTRVLASLSLPDTIQHVDDPLKPNMDAPEFPQPMYEALRDLSQDLFLPGLGDVPANTVAVLETNP